MYAVYSVVVCGYLFWQVWRLAFSSDVGRAYAERGCK